MKSWHIAPGRGHASLSLRTGDLPSAGRDQVVVKMRASAVGYRDLQVLANNYPIPITDGVIGGCEGVGEVVAVGEGVHSLGPGDRVAATVFPNWVDGPFRRENAAQLGTMIDGVWTEYAVLEENAVVAVPDHLSDVEAATLPLAAVTAWNALTTGRPLLPGTTVLTLGSGAVSLWVLHFAKSAGTRVIITTSSAAKAVRLRTLGANHAIDRDRTPDWSAAVRELTAGRGADLVVDPTGPLDQVLKAVAPGGDIAFVGYWISGQPGKQPVDPGLLFSAGATVRRIAAGSRAHFVELNRAVAHHRLRPVIDKAFSFADLPAALAYVDAGGGFGKVVIEH